MARHAASYLLLRLCCGLLLLAAVTPCRAQHNFPLSPAATRILVDSLASQLVKHYVFKDTALKMSALLKKRLKQGHYANIADPHTLAGRLTDDVRSVYRDEHFHVAYQPEMIAELSNNIEDVPRMVQERLNRERARNFGFRKAELLPGNIGYLEISSFSRLNQYSRAAATAALQMVANARALVLDLRYGSGGSPEMINYLMGYFLKEKTHTADVYIPSEKARIAWWSQPDTTLPRLAHIPLFVLTSYKTFSAAEGLSYELQAFKRATLVGETTRGGAHTVSYRPLSSGFVVDLPFGRMTCPLTGGNWEAVGVQPDVAVASDEALYTACELALAQALATADPAEHRQLQWEAEALHAEYHPFEGKTTVLRELAGSYGAYRIDYSGGKLFYQKAGMARFSLVPMNDTLLRVKGNDTFRVAFQRDTATGKINRIVTLYQDGHAETAQRKE